MSIHSEKDNGSSLTDLINKTWFKIEKIIFRGCFSNSLYLQTAREVGGDFYDVAILGDGNVGVMIADVADKGVHATLFMAVSRTLSNMTRRLRSSPLCIVAFYAHQWTPL